MKNLSLFIVIFYLGIYSSYSQCTDPATISYKDTCLNNVTQFHGTAFGDPSDWLWHFGEPSSGKNDTARGADPVHIYKNPGNYSVTLSFPNSCGDTTTITQNIQIKSTPTFSVDIKDTVLCDTNRTITASVSGGGSFTYHWSNADSSKTIPIKNGGKYWVKAYQNGCYATDTAKIKIWGQGNKGDYNWVFGDKGGLNFNNTPPSKLNSNGSTQGGSSAISDPRGKMLFYSDGKNIYNKNNQIMDGGADITPATDSSQAVLIVPDPRVNNIYYVFNVNSNGLSYSIVDLSENKGLGKVTQKNIPLHKPVTQQIAGTKDDSGKNFWMVTHELHTNKFLAYKIGPHGLETTAVTSSVGSVVDSEDGNIKFSQDGQKAVIALPDQNKVEVYDFDNSTGKFTLTNTITNVTNPLGVEFSPDKSKLYVSTDGDGHLYQFNIGGSDSTVNKSRKLISNDPSTSYNAMQLGPDGKIYVVLSGSGSGSLGVITDPDLDSTAAGFHNKAINIGSQGSFGLTNFIANYFQKSDWQIMAGNACTNSPTSFQATAPDTVFSWHWSFGDGSSDTGQFVSHTYKVAGSYNVSVKAIYPCGDTTMKKTIQVFDTPKVNLNDITKCEATTVVLDATFPGAEYLWSTGSKGPKISTDTSGTFMVMVDNNGCSATDSSHVTFAIIKPINLGPDQTLCEGQTVTLIANNPGLTHQWSNGATGDTVTVSSSGNYSVTVKNGNACQQSDDVNINFIIPPVVFLGPQFMKVCEGTPVTLDAGNHPGFTIKWTTGATSQQIHPTKNGTYGVAVSQGKCSSGDTINLEFQNGPSVSLPPQAFICHENNETVTLDAGGSAFGYLWIQSGETTQTITVSKEGTYTVQATDLFGCTKKVSTNVKDVCAARLFVPTIFSPNSDGSNDEFIVSGANIISYDLEIYNRWGELIFVSRSLSDSWNGIYRGTLVQGDVYAWKITYTGETPDGLKTYVKSGDVTVLR